MHKLQSCMYTVNIPHVLFTIYYNTKIVTVTCNTCIIVSLLETWQCSCLWNNACSEQLRKNSYKSISAILYLWKTSYSVMILTLNILSKLGGTTAGESAGTILVNSSEKLLTSSSLVILGTNGAGMAFLDRSSQLIF